ncbi:MAG: peptidase M64 [Bacteroidales bacterium]|nr:peptidase M64 [Bacteroidales bacterium]
MKFSHLLLFIALLPAFFACRETPAPHGNGTTSYNFEGKVDYDTYFTPERMRVEFILAGDASKQEAYLGGIYREAEWTGSPNSLIDPFGYGEYYFEAFSGEQLVFSTGFCSLFSEWRTTAEASKVARSMPHNVWMPFPKEPVRIVLYERRKADNAFQPLLEATIDPEDRLINSGRLNGYPVDNYQISGPDASKVDLLFVAEGYSEAEMGKFRKDAARFAEYMFTLAPYSERRNDFNIRFLLSASGDSGVDIPQDGIWKNTVCESNFYTFYIDRYLTISDHSKIADAVSGAPFDAIFIVANCEKYGGGGIYNSYALGTSDNSRSDPVFIHEFGHSFAGLADEYFTSEVAYEDFYNLALEPWEPNITTLKDFGSKWADMLPEGAVIPTQPNDSTMLGVLGVFEGGGYMAKGVYRPYFDCRMHHNDSEGFCPVCQRAISRMIDHYTK